MSQSNDDTGRNTPSPGENQPSGGGIDPEEIPPRETLAAEVLRQCEAVVEQYRTGSLEKVQAVIELQEAIPRDDEQRFRDALAAQLRIIDSIDRVRDGGGARGSIVAGGLNGQAQPPTEDEHDGHGDGNGASEGPLTGKRVRSPVADYNDDDGDDYCGGLAKGTANCAGSLVQYQPARKLWTSSRPC